MLSPSLHTLTKPYTISSTGHMSTSTPTPTPTSATTRAAATPMQLQRLRFLVHGTVQGVYFRVFTQRSAQAHHVTGFVYNTTNGKVAGEAQGRPEDLKKLLKELDEGSPGSKVVRKLPNIWFYWIYHLGVGKRTLSVLTAGLCTDPGGPI